jgi:hypothetical protein
VIYDREKVYYFNNINTISIMKANNRDHINWAKTMYKHLVKVLDKWTKSQAKMLEGKGKMGVKHMCHFALVTEVFIQRWMHQAEKP